MKDGMGGPCGPYGEKINEYRVLTGKYAGKRHPGKPKYRKM
jgi:hypothetical protein